MSEACPRRRSHGRHKLQNCHQPRLGSADSSPRALTMFKGLSLLFMLLLSATAHAENWPGEQWSQGSKVTGPALKALEDYAFPTRDDSTRKGIRTDALLVIRDGQLVYERYAGVTKAETPHLTWSVSKSVMASVLGVAFAEWRFQLSDPVAKFYSPFNSHP